MSLRLNFNIFKNHLIIVAGFVYPLKALLPMTDRPSSPNTKKWKFTAEPRSRNPAAGGEPSSRCSRVTSTLSSTSVGKPPTPRSWPRTGSGLRVLSRPLPNAPSSPSKSPCPRRSKTTTPACRKTSTPTCITSLRQPSKPPRWSTSRMRPN